MEGTRVGKVIHYYDKISVAIIELESELKIGDKIKFVRGGEPMFEQEVQSLQNNHQAIESAQAGESVGLKVNDEVKEDAEIYKE